MGLKRYEPAVALWQRRRITNDAELAEDLNAYRIAFAYHSGNIENPQITYHDTREVFEHDGVSAYTGDLQALFEIRNARDAYELLVAAFRDRRALDETLLKAYQFRLTQNTCDTRRWQLGERPGAYKKHDYVTGKAEIAAAPEDVQEEVAELLSELADTPPAQALSAAAYFHAKLENIHPFADGNDRTGRLAMNYLLILHNHPPVIIHQEDRKAYYAALEAWDEVEPLVRFLREQTGKTWEKQVERTERKYDLKRVLSRKYRVADKEILPED